MEYPNANMNPDICTTNMDTILDLSFGLLTESYLSDCLNHISASFVNFCFKLKFCYIN